jgi:hypothetical protein
MSDLRESVEALTGTVHEGVGDKPIPGPVHKQAEKREQKRRVEAHGKAISLPAVVLLLLLAMSLDPKGRATMIGHPELFQTILAIAVVWLVGAIAVVEYLVRRRRANEQLTGPKKDGVFLQ